MLVISVVLIMQLLMLHFKEQNEDLERCEE